MTKIVVEVCERKSHDWGARRVSDQSTIATGQDPSQAIENLFGIKDEKRRERFSWNTDEYTVVLLPPSQNF